ncbi:MAG TPA: decarboxylating 6-phosphogluconate dehydrogenase [Nitrospirota bacterium]|nr:decarboxylating 6-phosphogluconate dehydrogenase [Nitrospirota bacterium]
MKLGYVGLGKMGFNMVERMLEKGHQVLAFDTSREAIDALAKKGAQGADSLRALVRALPVPRLIWIMVPQGAVDTVLGELIPSLEKGDAVIDGGNSPYKESMRRARELQAREIDFLDAGVSGGPAGARTGACIMVGGEQDVYKKFEPLFRDLSADKGYGYVGRSGAGHFVKMVHNGIEYGMMQALAEGFSVMKASGFGLDLAAVAGLYNHRSVIESRLVGWLKEAFDRFGEELSAISGSVAQSGEGLWTVDAAKELGVPVPVISGALDFRMQSKELPSYTGKIVSALRNRFGGHTVTNS